MIGAIAGVIYSESYFDPWVTTSGTIVGVEEQIDRDAPLDIKYCPKIQFFTVGEDTVRNITTVLDSDCENDPEDVDLGDLVEIQYDPSDPTDVVDAFVPDILRYALIGFVVTTVLCSGCFAAIAIHSYKATKNSSNNNGQHQITYPFANNQSTPSSIPMTNLGGNNAAYADPNGYNSNNAYGNSEPVGNTYAETAPSAVFVSPDGTQLESAPAIVAAYPEGTAANTGIAAGEEAPPLVGCTLLPANNVAPPVASSETYASPSDIPLNPVAPTSSYVSPSDIHEAMATVDRRYR